MWATYRLTLGAVLVAIGPLVAACGEKAKLPLEAGIGPAPVLPEPNETLLPTVKIAPAKAWTGDQSPTPANGLAVASYAADLQHPRWLHVLPNGDVLVAETNAPERPEEGKGLKGWAMTQAMKRAGSKGTSADRITLLRDSDGDGVVDLRTTFIDGLHSPFGMTLVGDDLYVANTDAVVRFPYRRGQTTIETPGETLADLPAGPRNHHWTKSLVASPDGSKLYVGVGSNSNVAENGIEAEQGRAAVWEIDRASGTARVFAHGLRNPVGLAFDPATRSLWAVVNERDELGSDLVPDYLTTVNDGGFYGWPYSYFGHYVDRRVQPERPDLVAQALKPDYALGAHVAPLGLAFADGNRLPARFATGAFVGEHGSWNRDPPSGYKVVFVPFIDGRPAGEPMDVLTGFLDGDGNASGRPVGVAIDGQGALLIADDVGNRIWRVTPAAGIRAAQGSQAR